MVRAIFMHHADRSSLGSSFWGHVHVRVHVHVHIVCQYFCFIIHIKYHVVLSMFVFMLTFNCIHNNIFKYMRMLMFMFILTSMCLKRGLMSGDGG